MTFLCSRDTTRSCPFSAVASDKRLQPCNSEMNFKVSVLGVMHPVTKRKAITFPAESDVTTLRLVDVLAQSDLDFFFRATIDKNKTIIRIIINY